jgi:hypothetical protein
MNRMSANAVDTPRRRMSGLRRLAPWLAGLVLVAGIIVAIVHFAPNRNAAPEQISKAPVKAPVKEKTVRLSKAATSVARQFVQTAVARADLAAAWKISGADVRGGLTRKEWMTGNIPVVPYPLQSLQTARFKVDFSYRDEALIEVALLPKNGSKIKPQVFAADLQRVAGPGGTRHWVVDSWIPKSATLVPQGAN